MNLEIIRKHRENPEIWRITDIEKDGRIRGIENDLSKLHHDQ